ncbi:MAG TPA: hypothetical protein VKU85_20880 [bacterium]|nr:hypothetical protein [bacterium]
MRSAISLARTAFIGACATLCACSDADRGPGPLSPSLSAPAFAELRIVSPADGSLVTGAGLSILAEQQVQGGPSQGVAQLQASADGQSWASLGAAFAWSAQDAYLTLGPVAMTGSGTAHLRLVVYEAFPQDPFLVSDVTTVRCLEQAEQTSDQPTR